MSESLPRSGAPHSSDADSGRLLTMGPDLLVRFSALLILATAIATFGLIGDSVATVIGAMIVAPLMTPIMGLAFGVSIGGRRAIFSSLLIVLASVAASIALGYLLALPFHRSIDVLANAQIASRTNPQRNRKSDTVLILVPRRSRLGIVASYRLRACAYVSAALYRG